MYHLFIATPEKVIFDAQVISTTAPGTCGYLQILTNHAAIMTTLAPGKLEVVDESQQKWLWAISGGFLEVLHNEASLLLDAAELPSEIDIQRAELAYGRAQKRIESKDSQTDIPRAKLALLRAKNRIHLAQSKSNAS